MFTLPFKDFENSPTLCVVRWDLRSMYIATKNHPINTHIYLPRRLDFCEKSEKSHSAFSAVMFMGHSWGFLGNHGKSWEYHGKFWKIPLSFICSNVITFKSATCLYRYCRLGSILRDIFSAPRKDVTLAKKTPHNFTQAQRYIRPHMLRVGTFLKYLKGAVKFQKNLKKLTWTF